jgi:hypothetical protein
MTEMTKKITIEEWRQLGYYYERNDDNKEWIITASPFGVITFAQSILRYAESTRFSEYGDHEHYGPYWYLKIMTTPLPEMNENAISGTKDDLKRLYEIIREKVDNSEPGSNMDIPVKSATNSGGNLPPETSRFDLRPSGRFGQGLALVFRNESPFSWIFSELENRRSQIASATVGSPKTSCQVVNGRWETTIVDACPQRSSRDFQQAHAVYRIHF